MKTVLITGVSSGLGKAVFDQLINKNVFLLCISRRFLNYQKDLAFKTSNVILYHQDLSNIESLQDNLDRIIGNIPPTSEEVVFINNAGVLEPIALAGKIADKYTVSSININYLAPVMITNRLLEYQKNVSFKTKIVNITSGAALRTISGWSLYCSSKAAAKMFFDCVSKETFANDQITVINFNPGVMDTKMQEKIRTSDIKDFPDVKRYIYLKENNMLKKPDNVAKELLREINLLKPQEAII